MPRVVSGGSEYQKKQLKVSTKSIEIHWKPIEYSLVRPKVFDRVNKIQNLVVSEVAGIYTEQQILMFEMFDRMSKVQNLVASEVTWYYNVIFYVTCLFVIYIATGTKRTEGARLLLLLVLTINFWVERMICRYS